MLQVVHGADGSMVDGLCSLRHGSSSLRTDSDSWSSGMDMGVTMLAPEVVGRANEQGITGGKGHQGRQRVEHPAVQLWGFARDQYGPMFWLFVKYFSDQ